MTTSSASRRSAWAHATLVAVLFLTAGCLETDIPPAGTYSEVLLVTEEGARGQIAQAVLPHLERRLDYYVSQDVQFKVAHIRAADLTGVPYFKNIIICGVASPLSSVGQLVVEQLGPSAVEKANTGQAQLFKQDNLPGPGQLTIIVTAGSKEELFEVLQARGGEVNAALEMSCRERLRYYLLKNKNAALGRRLQQKYGFVIEVPTLYKLFSDEADPPGIELMRDGPARSLGIFWLDWDSPPTLEHKRKLFNMRAEYVYRRYDGDVMDWDRVRFSSGYLGTYPAIKMEGYWSNSNSLAGGCYETYFLHDERQRLLWVVDLLVYAPGLPKHRHFRELLALAETFRYD